MELERLKELLGMKPGETDNDAVLVFTMDTVQETILNYCNLDELPEGLIHTAYRMAVDLYRYEHPGEAAAPVMVKSISEGDTSTSFGDASEALKDSILKNYRAQLNRYRKLRW